MLKRETIFSPCRKYRYTLWREWDGGLFDDVERGEPGTLGYVQFIGLNPSTADETKDDPTIRRCRAFAKAWGYGAMCMTNLFAWRDTSPAKMKREPYPIGPENDDWLSMIAHDASLIVAAWGTHGEHMRRGDWVKTLIPNLQCIRKTDGGFPQHPLYLPKTLTPIPL